MSMTDENHIKDVGDYATKLSGSLFNAMGHIEEIIPLNEQVSIFKPGESELDFKLVVVNDEFMSDLEIAELISFTQIIRSLSNNPYTTMVEIFNNYKVVNDSAKHN